MDPEPNQERQPPAVVGEGEATPRAPTVPPAEPVAVSPSNVPNVVPGTKKRGSRTRPKAGSHPNNVKKLRQRAMMSKAELARRAGVSPLTIDRVEAGCPCRMDTKRKVLEALGLEPTSAREVFPDVDLG